MRRKNYTPLTVDPSDNNLATKSLSLFLLECTVEYMLSIFHYNENYCTYLLNCAEILIYIFYYHNNGLFHEAESCVRVPSAQYLGQ